MGRIRTVKPELFMDEVLGKLSGDHLALFVGLFTVADREGRLRWRPERLKATLFPYRPVDVAALGADLDTADKVQLYDIEGESYLWIPGFVRHQRPHPKEPASDLPPAPSRVRPRPAVIESSTIPSSPVGREGKEILEGNGMDHSPSENPRAAPAGVKRDTVQKKRPTDEGDPRTGGDSTYRALVAALFVLFREKRGADYDPSKRDWVALADLRGRHDAAEIIRRWGIGLLAAFKARCDTFWDLRERWNALTAPEAVGGRVVKAAGATGGGEVVEFPEWPEATNE